jgi:L-fuculose-phosphate aldolase
MSIDTTATIDELRAAGRSLLAGGLAWGNAGNLSARTSTESYVITASGTRLGELGPGDFVTCRIGAPHAGDRRPSKERPMHEAVYATRPEVRAVLHASPFYSTLAACSEFDPPSNLLVETIYYLERTARVPYYHPGSAELGAAVGAVAPHANLLLLEHHGVLAYDTSVQEALMGLQTLELACRMVVEARAAGIALRGLPAEVERDFLERAGYKPRREWSV